MYSGTSIFSRKRHQITSKDPQVSQERAKKFSNVQEKSWTTWVSSAPKTQKFITGGH